MSFIPDNLQNIEIFALAGCSSIGSYTSGTEVKSIGKEAFSDCTALTSFTSLAATPPTCGSQALYDINKWECKLLVPEHSLDDYRAADQ
ncbi:MAG: leucine-rich repeat domain-containing protein [Muribaculaceae bacterium]|nr:leucine-rich repeat domain-containing protein [Muribaculaceae bacterium]